MKLKLNVVNEPEPGVPLNRVEFGSVVQKVFGAKDVYYLVVATMDGTGHRGLVTLPGGTLHFTVDQWQRVIEVDAELVV